MQLALHENNVLFLVFHCSHTTGDVHITHQHSDSGNRKFSRLDSCCFLSRYTEKPAKLLTLNLEEMFCAVIKPIRDSCFDYVAKLGGYFVTSGCSKCPKTLSPCSKNTVFGAERPKWQWSSAVAQNRFSVPFHLEERLFSWPIPTGGTVASSTAAATTGSGSSTAVLTPTASGTSGSSGTTGITTPAGSSTMGTTEAASTVSAGTATTGSTGTTGNSSTIAATEATATPLGEPPSFSSLARKQKRSEHNQFWWQMWQMLVHQEFSVAWGVHTCQPRKTNANNVAHTP